MMPSWPAKFMNDSCHHGWTTKLALQGRDNDVRRQVMSDNAVEEIVYRGEIIRVNVPRYSYRTSEVIERINTEHRLLDIKDDINTEQRALDITDKLKAERKPLGYKDKLKAESRFSDIISNLNPSTMYRVKIPVTSSRRGSPTSMTRYHSDPNIVDSGRYDSSRNEIARTVALHKQNGTFGFVLFGASSQLQREFGHQQFYSSVDIPALQYLNSVTERSAADLAGLQPGDFILEVNGKNVSCETHERTVQLMQQNADVLQLKVISKANRPVNYVRHVLHSRDHPELYKEEFTTYCLPSTSHNTEALKADNCKRNGCVMQHIHPNSHADFVQYPNKKCRMCYDDEKRQQANVASERRSPASFLRHRRVPRNLQSKSPSSKNVKRCPHIASPNRDQTSAASKIQAINESKKRNVKRIMQIRVSPERNADKRFTIDRVTSVVNKSYVCSDEDEPVSLLNNNQWSSLVNVHNVPCTLLSCNSHVLKSDNNCGKVIGKLSKIKSTKPLVRRFASADNILDDTPNLIQQSYSQTKLNLQNVSSQTGSGLDVKSLVKDRHSNHHDIKSSSGLSSPLSDITVSPYRKKITQENIRKRSNSRPAGRRQNNVKREDRVNIPEAKAAIFSKTTPKTAVPAARDSMTTKWTRSTTGGSNEDVSNSAGTARVDVRKINLNLNKVKTTSTTNKVDVDSYSLRNTDQKTSVINCTNTTKSIDKSLITNAAVDTKIEMETGFGRKNIVLNKPIAKNRESNKSHFSAVTKSLAKKFEHLTAHNSSNITKPKANEPIPSKSVTINSSSNKKRNAPKPPTASIHKSISTETNDATMRNDNKTLKSNYSNSNCLIKSILTKDTKHESSENINFIAMAEKARHAYLVKTGKLEVTKATDTGFMQKVSVSGHDSQTDHSSNKMSVVDYNQITLPITQEAGLYSNASNAPIISSNEFNDYMNRSEINKSAMPTATTVSSGGESRGLYDDALSIRNKLHSSSSTSQEGGWTSSHDEAPTSSALSSTVVQSDSDFYSSSPLASRGPKFSQLVANKNQYPYNGIMIDQFSSVPPPIGFEDESDYANLSELDILPPPDEFKFLL